MEYIVFAIACGLFILVVAVREIVTVKRREKEYTERLRTKFGELEKKEYKPERIVKIPTYYRKHPCENVVDDITWNDLDFDGLFRQMNHTLSATGEEYLYFMLRDLSKSEDELKHLEELVEFFDRDEETRLSYQLKMHKLGYTGKYSLYDYMDHLDILGKRSNWKEIIADILFIPCIILIPFIPSIGFLCLALLIVYNILTYFRQKNEIEPYIISFQYILRLINISKTIEKMPITPAKQELERLHQANSTLSAMNRGSFWVMTQGHSTIGSNPVEILVDYIRMVFHVDILQFNRMYHIVKNHLPETDMLITTVGYLECCVAIAAFRRSLKGEYCVPVFTKERKGILIRQGYHPMLTGAVKNDIDAQTGILLTGSNASGKSTFLKMTAINVILAQTIHTCACREYAAPMYRVYSSMSLRDDLRGGESYFIVEIKAMKRIMDAAGQADRPIICFVDEVLRGTNTVERIAAAYSLIKGLVDSGCQVFAATHDIELTKLLCTDLTNYHFEEEVTEGDVLFSYHLCDGPAKTRNAIKLLEVLGFDKNDTARAAAIAKHFDETGIWSNLLDEK